MFRDIKVITTDSTTGKISFSLFKCNDAIRDNKQALLQSITLLLLNDKGSNSWDYTKGSSIASLTGSTYSKGQEDVVKTLISVGIKEIEKQILNEQANTTFTGDELDGKLSSIEIMSIVYDEITAAWATTILVKTASNNIGFITF